MNVLNAYSESWRQRGFVVPIFVAVRLLSLAIVVPLLGFLARLAISLSDQAALTDQDIALFLLTPVGFAAFLGVAALILIGSVIGLATMTLELHDRRARGYRAILPALHRLGRRFPSLMRYAVELVVRILIIVLPFAAVSLVVANRLLGEYDINYYLTARPREFFIAAGIIGALVAAMVLLLLSRLLPWAVSMHFVLLGGVDGGAAFAKSAARMKGRLTALLRDLVVWFAIRLILVAALAAVFGWLMQHVAGEFGEGFRTKLTAAIVLATIWGLAGLLVTAISLGALARILNGYYGESPSLNNSAGHGETRLLTAPILLTSAMALLAFGLSFGTILVGRVETDNSVEVIGHRGAAGARPENTMASIVKAVEDGADWVEIDVQETADGEVLVVHDSDFMKLAGVNKKVWDVTMADVAQIDIGGWFDPAYSSERAPRLADVLQAVKDKSRLLIELKFYDHNTDLENRTIALVEAAGMADQVATMSLKYPLVQNMLKLRPDWPSGVLAATAIGNLAGLEGDFIAVNAGIAGPKLVKSVHAAGKKLYVWTINDPLQMSAMISMGVDGLITDEPALARRVIEERANLTTAERLFILFATRFGLSVPDKEYRDASP